LNENAESFCLRPNGLSVDESNVRGVQQRFCPQLVLLDFAPAHFFPQMRIEVLQALGSTNKQTKNKKKQMEPMKQKATN